MSVLESGIKIYKKFGFKKFVERAVKNNYRHKEFIDNKSQDGQGIGLIYT